MKYINYWDFFGKSLEFKMERDILKVYQSADYIPCTATANQPEDILTKEKFQEMIDNCEAIKLKPSETIRCFYCSSEEETCKKMPVIVAYCNKNSWFDPIPFYINGVICKPNSGMMIMEDDSFKVIDFSDTDLEKVEKGTGIKFELGMNNE
jgi:hypothetical protein